MSVVNDGFSGAQPTTKSLLVLGLNITTENYGPGKAQGEHKESDWLYYYQQEILKNSTTNQDIPRGIL